ncbi:MAG: CPBP family intramembrane glutamic endopeptidase [Luteibaculaceae bacterium]
MHILKTVTLVLLAIATLFLGSSKIIAFNFHLHQHSYINAIANYQLFAFLVALVVLGIFLILKPKSKKYLALGKLLALPAKEKWLGINGKSSWLKNGFELSIVISLATAGFMLFGANAVNSMHNFEWWFIPVALIFAVTNSLSEEIIFRFGVIAGLDGHYPKQGIQILSAILFGLPHYFGNPSGIIGVLMAGFLGYVLCKAALETQGLGIAWFIHFIQDVIIYLALFSLNL